MSESAKDSDKAPINDVHSDSAMNNSRSAVPVTNPELVDAMAKFKLDLKNRTNEIAFLQAAIAAKYLLPAMFEQPAEQPKPGEQVRTRVAFQIMTNPQNEKFIPAFTDEIELKKNRKPGERFQVAVMSFMDLYRFVKSNEEIRGIVINPFGSALCLVRQQVIAIGDNDGKIVTTPASLANMDKIKSSDALDAGKDKISNGIDDNNSGKINLVPNEPEPPRPSNPLGAAVASADDAQAAIREAMAAVEAAAQSEEPETAKEAVTDEVLSALKAALKKQKAVKKAYIRQESESGRSYLLVALETEGNVEEIGEAVNELVKSASELPFEFASTSSIRAKELVAEEKPFYEKKRFGLF